MIGKLMMATRAHGDPKAPNSFDISRKDPDLIRVQREDGEFWVGAWVEGMGFINVYFPKATTRPCTAEEKGFYLRCQWEVPSVGIMQFKSEDFA